MSPGGSYIALSKIITAYHYPQAPSPLNRVAEITNSCHLALTFPNSPRRRPETGHDSTTLFFARRTGRNRDEDSRTQVTAANRGTGEDSAKDSQILAPAEIDGRLDRHPCWGARFL